MPSSLTQAESVRRAELLRVGGYRVDLDLTRGEASFGSTVTVRFQCAEPGAATFLDLVGELRQARLNGRELEPGALADDRLALTDLAADNELSLTSEMAYSRTGEGLHRFVDPADDNVYLYAQSAVEDARRIFGCFDQPDLKAPIALTVTAPEGWTVLGNGTGTHHGDGRWEFTETQPISTYLFTVCAGRYHSRYQEHDGLTLGWHCRASLAEHMEPDLDELFTLTRQCMDWYQRTFRMSYPFGESYDQVFVPEFNAGAMENPGCVTFRDELVYRSAVTDAERALRAMIIAHEMAHMWFGDLVTLRWWNDIWLNESFAEYLGFRVTGEATRFSDAWAAFGAARKQAGYMADQAPSTHPIAGEAPTAAHARLLLDMISYPKGASALRQLAAWLGDEAFLAGLRSHFDRHAYANATLADLIDVMAETSGRDVRAWAERWLRTAQVDTLRPVVELDADGRYTSVVIEQTTPAEYPTPRPHRIALGLYDLNGTGVSRRKQIEVDIDPSAAGGRTPVPALVGQPAPDLLLVNDDDLTFAKVRFDPRSARALPEVLPRLTDPLNRAVLWSAAWDLTRAGELAPESYVDLVAAGLGTETDLSVLESNVRWAERFAARRYVPPERRAAALGTLCAAGRSLLAAAAPGSGHQLAAAQMVAKTAITDDEVALLRGWLAGTGVPAGLVMDAELRWAVLGRLVVLGAAGEAGIAAEAERDSTARGAVHATELRAALPDAAAKERAWTALTTDRTLSNRYLEAMALGFWQENQAELTAPYVSRYFAEVPPSASWRSIEMLAMLVPLAYPSHAVSEETVAAAERLLADDTLHPMVRRGVVDRTHEIRLALASRAASASGHA